MLFAQIYSIRSSTDIPSDFVCILGLAAEIMDASDRDMQIVQCMDIIILMLLRASPYLFWRFQRT